MKIRTDFVTNSSSSSFVALTVFTRDGEKYTMAPEMDAHWHDEAMPVLDAGELKYTYCAVDNEDEEDEAVIESVIELAAVLYFNDCYEPIDFAVISPIFSFLIGKLSAKRLIKALCEVEGFEELEDIDPEDYDDKDELREAVLEVLEEALAEMECYVDLSNEEVIKEYKEFVTGVAALDDIEKIEVHHGETDWDEFTNIYVERLNMFTNEHPFAAVADDSSEYDDAFSFWCGVMENEVLMGAKATYEQIPDLVAKALASGTSYDMIPRSVTSESVLEYYVSDSDEDE